MKASCLLYVAGAAAAYTAHGVNAAECQVVDLKTQEHSNSVLRSHDIAKDDAGEPGALWKRDSDVEGDDDMPGMMNDDASDMPPSPMSMAHHHGRPILDNPDLEPQQRKYWEQYNTTTYFSSEEGNKFNLWMHTVLVAMSVGLFAPLAVMMSEDKRTQWFYVPLQTLQTAMLVAAVVFLALYAANAPKLYPGNAYAPYSIAILILAVTHWVAMVARSVSNYMRYDGEYELTGSSEPLAANSFALEEFSDEQHESTTECGSSGDNDAEFTGMSASRKFAASTQPQPSKLVRKFARNRFFIAINHSLGSFSTFIFRLLNVPLFFAELGYLLTGLATAFLMGKGRYVFALLAHFIKGFVFFALGFIELSRYFGACASRGYAWNEIYVRSKATHNRGLISKLQFWPENPTVEYWQSAAMFLYGSTNVFLEHLGNTDGVWSHKDLQHASIAFMMFGGGLCGMILESRFVKKCLESAFRVRPTDSDGNRRGWSYNPMPAFIVFWTGALMSHHEQETELSTAIHIQWGTMFSMAALVRLITLAILLVRTPPATEEAAAQPQRPFTELLVSFLLICGGMIFMSSNRETVEGMIYRGIDQMFTLNVSVGFTVIFMAVFVLGLSIRGWASRRYA